MATQTAAINALIHAAAAHNLGVDDTALLLAIVRRESGFNPDAAVGVSSASGLGQFPDGTGKEFGLTSANRWDLSAQANAAVEFFVKCENTTKAAGLDNSHIYAFWQAGLNSAGKVGKAEAFSDAINASINHVMPHVSAYKTYLEGGIFGLAAASGDAPDAGRLHAIAMALGGPLAPGCQMHDLALYQGRPAIGGIAPVGRRPGPGPKLPPRDGAETPEHGADAGAGQVNEASNPGFRAILAQASAQAATGRQAREVREAALRYASTGSVLGHAIAPGAPGTAGGTPLSTRIGSRQHAAARAALAAAAHDLAADTGLGATQADEAPHNLYPAPHVMPNTACATLPGIASPEQGAVSQADITQALEAYAFRQSRLPPRGGAAFNPLLSPQWAGRKVPG